MPIKKPTTTPIGSEDTTNLWEVAIKDAEARIAALNRECYRLRKAIRLMRQQVKDGVPWPTPKNAATNSISEA